MAQNTPFPPFPLSLSQVEERIFLFQHFKISTSITENEKKRSFAQNMANKKKYNISKYILYHFIYFQAWKMFVLFYVQ